MCLINEIMRLKAVKILLALKYYQAIVIAS